MGDAPPPPTGGKAEKSYFDVLGICCPSEVPLVEKLLAPLPGVRKVTVIVPSRTVIVHHDPAATSPAQIVKVLNQAKLDASVRAYGTSTEKITNKWPSPYVIFCGVFLLVSLFEHFWRPLRWFALGAVAAGALPILQRSYAAARRLTLDVNILMLIAVSGAIALKDYSEAGFIVFLFTTAEWLETRASHKATAGMSSLMSMTPQKAVLAETGQVVAAQDVKVNTVIAVKAGEIIPIDGVVVDGRSEVDESTLTGESFPVAKQPESEVWAGTLNIDGYIAVRTTAMADNSAVAKMARLVEEAQNSRSNTQRLIDTCAKYYTPAVVAMAAGVALIPVMIRAHNLKHMFQLALVLLVSACPCALVLSTPIATFCALLTAARTGLLIKGGDVLESLAKIKIAAFDKTGTITRGEFCVEEFQAVGGRVSIQQLLYWVSSIESRSSHPMASVLVDYAQSKSVEPKSDNVSEFQIYPGEGIYGEIDGEGVYIGNKRILSRASCGTVPDKKDMKGVTVGYVACKNELIGVFTLSDSCRTGSAEAIKELRSLGIKSVMLTGDSAAAAAYAQEQLGNILDEVHSELLPEDKVRIVDELKEKHGPTLMIGDGMNDAPALAKADVGVSMGVSGSAVAMETSHITLMSNDIRRIPKAVQLARRTNRTIIVNIFFSVITKLAIVGLAIAGHPLIWAAVLADVGTCLLVIMYSMLLLRSKGGRNAKKCCASSQHGSHAKKHCVSGHCSDGPCKPTGSCKEPSSGKHGCHDHDHDHSHTHCKEQATSSIWKSMLAMIMATATATATTKSPATRWLQKSMLAMTMGILITTAKSQATRCLLRTTVAMPMSIAIAKKPILCNMTATAHAMSMSMSITTVKNTIIHILPVNMLAMSMSMSIATVKSTTIHILQLSKLARIMIMSTSITATLCNHLYKLQICITAMTMTMTMSMTTGRLRNQKRTAMPSYITTTTIAAMSHMGRRRRLRLSQFKSSLSLSIHYLMRITSSITRAATTVKNTR
ncbi:unnamed protein product [Urochloa humidicola]